MTKAKGDTKICRKVRYLGSRMNEAPICKTKREWDELQWEHDHMVREQQMLNRTLSQ